mgnify:CR=1 FL=1
MTGRITAFYSVKLLAPLWVKIFQYIGKALLFQAKLIINILVFCDLVISKIIVILNKKRTVFILKLSYSKKYLFQSKSKEL